MEEQNRRRVSVFEDDEIPYEVRMKHLIKSYRKDLKRLEELSQYAKGLEEENLLLQKKIEVSGQDDAAKAQWFPLTALPELAFDHEEIMKDAINVYGNIMN